MKVVFHRSLKIGEKIYPRNKKAVVQIDDKLADHWFVKAALESGDMAIAPAVVAKKPEAAKKDDDKKKADVKSA